MSKEAMKLALEALGWTDEWRPEGLKEQAITALREALADQPAQQALDKMAENARELGLDYEPAQQQEPVAWRYLTQYDNESVWTYCAGEPANRETRQPLYTSPQPSKPWVGLTDEEVKHQWEVWRASIPRYAGFARGIEAKLREKNNG